MAIIEMSPTKDIEWNLLDMIKTMLCPRTEIEWPMTLLHC
jgi:hypothetical protein